MADLLQFRRDIHSRLTEANPIIGNGELVYISDLNVIRIGDGITNYNDLSNFEFDFSFTPDAFKIADSSITTDGTLQTIFNYTGIDKPQYITGWLNISNMIDGDEIDIIISINDVFFSQVSYMDAVDISMIYLKPHLIPVNDNYKIQIQRTAGTDHSYPFQLFKTI